MTVKILLRSLLLASVLVPAANAAALADPPDRVGRVSFVQGTVSTHTADEDQWSYAALNMPVTSGDSFWTEPGAKSEVQVGAAELRMDGGTEVDIGQLDDNGTRLSVSQGVINVHLHDLPPGGVLVQTPQGQVNLTQAGSYDIDAGQPDQSGQGAAPDGRVTVLEGQAEIDGPRSRINIMPGESALVSNGAASFNLTEGNATPFDDWALARENRERVSQTAQYVSPETTGYEDLDANGTWSPDPDYGQVWYPQTVPSDWAPYRYGRWEYVQPWGWTWIDDAPWGFAPFHYGRWVQRENRWGWVPGERVEHPVYAPALVAFIGGNGWNVALTDGARPAVGWVPLAPHEPFRPYYQTSERYRNEVNNGFGRGPGIANINVNVNSFDHFANRGGATVVPSDAFTGGHHIHKVRLNVAAAQLSSAPVTPNVSDLKPQASARIENARPAGMHNDHGQAPSSQPGENRVVPPAPSPHDAEGHHNEAPDGVAPRTPAERAALSADELPKPVPPSRHPQPQAESPAVAAHAEAEDKPVLRGGAPGPSVHHFNSATIGGPSVVNRDLGTPAHQPGMMTGEEPNPSAQRQGTPEQHGIPDPQRHPETAGAPVEYHSQAATPEHAAAPKAEAPVQHPVQHTHMTPTAQGWKRTSSDNHPAPAAHGNEVHGAPATEHKDDKKPDDGH